MALDGASTSLPDDNPPSPSCKLVPPCKPVYHGLRKKQLGRYCFTVDTLKHDIAALKQGEIYERDEFYLRAKAWYKAEIDRLLHLEAVRQAAAQSQFTAPEPPPQSGPLNRRYRAPVQVPTRIQPARAAKRRHVEQAPPKRLGTQQKKEPVVAPTEATEFADPNPERETRGDYTLAAYDWDQFRSGNEAEHGRSPWSYIQFQGLDVAYFSMRLERAVNLKIDEMGHGTPPREGHNLEKHKPPDGNTGVPPSRAYDYAHTSNNDQTHHKLHNPQLTIHSRPHHPPCPLDLHHHHHHHRHHQPAPAPFTFKAALAPGEDWRPPTWPSRPGTHTLNPAIPSTSTAAAPVTVTNNNNVAPAAQTAPSPPTSAPHIPNPTTPIRTWAADEVRRREELTKRAAAAQAPEADMEISPTLGRWRLSLTGVGTSGAARGDCCRRRRRRRVG